MQLSSQIKPYTWPQPLSTERLLPASDAQLIFALVLIVLSFVPLVPMVDALEGGLSARGMIEFGLLLAGLGMLAIYLKAQGAFSFDLRSPAFLLISLFTFWGILSSIWSFNPLLTIAKSAELWCVSLAGLMFVTLAWRSRMGSGKLERLLGLSMALVVGGLIAANIFYWGKPLPTTGDTSLPLELIGHEVISDRPRLILAYQHELLTADLLALAVICLLTCTLNKVWKAVLIPCLLALLWLTDARGPTAGLLVAMTALAVLRLRRNDVRAIVLMLALSIAVAAVLVFHDRLPAAVSSLMTDDVSTLNSRTELWAASVKHVLARPILGTGYFASRYLLLKEFTWAGHAHNSFLEVLITTGLVGLLILLAFVFYVIKKSIKTRSPFLLAVTLYCLIQGMMNPLFFNPGLAMFVLTIAVFAAGYKDRDCPNGSPSHFGRGLDEDFAKY
jgi:O-antigen ligase